MPVALARPFWNLSGGLWMPRIFAARTAELGPCHQREAGLALSQQAGWCGQEARGPLGSWAWEAQLFQACRFLQCLNREALCARLPEKSLFTFACVTEAN